MFKRLFLIAALFSCGLFFTLPAYAEIAIIIHPNANFELNEEDVRRIFLGKEEFFPDGSKIKAVEFDNKTQVFGEFCKKVARKTVTQFKAYWSRMIFTGKAPPMTVGRSSSEIIQLVASDPQYIGYVPVSEVNDSVKVVIKY